MVKNPIDIQNVQLVKITYTGQIGEVGVLPDKYLYKKYIIVTKIAGITVLSLKVTTYSSVIPIGRKKGYLNHS